MPVFHSIRPNVVLYSVLGPKHLVGLDKIIGMSEQTVSNTIYDKV